MSPLKTTGLPNQYEPDVTDFRTVVEVGWGPVYEALALAIQECEDVEKALATDDGAAINRQVLRATRRASSALRTAAWVLAGQARSA
jgi:hypothetical protein